MDIVFENKAFIVLNKPKGLITEKNPFEDSLESQLENYLVKKGIKKVFIGVVHRLDKVTSGLIVFALKKSVLKNLNKQIENKEFKKIYYAKVKGSLNIKNKELVNWLFIDKKNKKAICYKNRVEGAKKATLLMNTIEATTVFSILEVNLRTGRYHQIRAQLAHFGFPILGDFKYQNKIDHTNKIELEAVKLSFNDPKSEKRVYFAIT